MLTETFLIGFTNLLSPGSVIVALTLLGLLLFFGQDKKSHRLIGRVFIFLVALLYCSIFQNLFAYVRYVLVDIGFVDIGYLIVAGIFIASGVFFFIQWFKLCQGKDISVIHLRYLTPQTKGIKRCLFVVLISVAAAIIVTFLAVDWVDDRIVFQFLIDAVVARDRASYYSVLGVYIFVLLFPLIIVDQVMRMIRSSQSEFNVSYQRMFVVVLAAVYLAAGLSFLYVR